MALHRRFVRNALAAALALGAHQAAAFEVTREFSGLWLDRNIPERYRPTVIWYEDREPESTDFLHNLDLNFSHNFSPNLVLSLAAGGMLITASSQSLTMMIIGTATTTFPISLMMKRGRALVSR